MNIKSLHKYNTFGNCELKTKWKQNGNKMKMHEELMLRSVHNTRQKDDGNFSRNRDKTKIDNVVDGFAPLLLEHIDIYMEK